MYYYIDSAGQQAGPVSADQLVAKGVTSETLVWKDGMNQWSKASEVTELRFLFDPNVPPPPPSNSTNSPHTEGSQANNLQTNTFGIIIGVVGVLYELYGIFNANGLWIWLILGLLAGKLIWFWKDLLGKEPIKNSSIWSIIILIIIGSLFNIYGW